MRAEDLPRVERLSAEAFYEADTRLLPPQAPLPQLRTPARAEGWMVRTAHLLETDPGGLWVAEADDDIVGMVVSFRRELMWGLASFAVRPGLQGQGIGRPLLDAALQHSQGCLRGMLSASADPKALRRYRAVGFEFHPQMFLTGSVDRGTLPVVEKVREGTIGDLDLLDSLDRRTRGAARGSDHEHLMASTRLLVSDTSTGAGYAYTQSNGDLVALAATNRRTAARLLWTVLADTPGPSVIGHVTAANQWAIEVGMAAGLRLHQSGYLALRGMKPPSPYVHHGALL